MNKHTKFAVSLFVAILFGLLTPSLLLARGHANEKCYKGQLDLGFGATIGTLLQVCFEGYPTPSKVPATQEQDPKSLRKKLSKLKFGSVRESVWMFGVPLRWTMKSVNGQTTRMIGLAFSSATTGASGDPGVSEEKRHGGVQDYPYFVVTIVDSSGRVSGSLYPLAQVKFDKDGKFAVIAIDSPEVRVSRLHEVRP
jgi:hypothetical protein